MALPPDRSHIATESRHDHSRELDALDTRDAIELIVEDHGEVQRAVEKAASNLWALVDALVPRIRANGRLIYIGAGTSGRLGVLDAAECPPTFGSDPEMVQAIIAGGDAALRRSSESREDEPEGSIADLVELELTDQDSLIGIAAGGTTPYVLGALRYAQGRGMLTALITCAPQARPLVACDHFILLDTGPELLTGSTRLKAGSATKLALNIITTLLFTRLGSVYSNLMIDLRVTNDKLLDRAIRTLRALCPDLTREDAHQVISEAGGELKRAIVMQRCGVDVDEADRLIDEYSGQLRPILAGG